MAKRLKAARLLAYLAVVGLGLLSVSGLGAQQTESDVFLLHIDNIIDPNHSKYLKRGIEKAEDEGGQAVIIQIDTPGGLVSSMRDMVRSIFASDIPVITFVSPQGARAGSAGTFVTAAGHIAAMAPGTNIGAATPISGTGEDLPDTLKSKVINDATALLRSIAETRGRDSGRLELTVTEAASFTVLEALEPNDDGQSIIDLIADDLDDLLAKIDGRVVALDTGGRQVTLHTAGIRCEKPRFRCTNVNLSFVERFLEVISDPNISGLLLSLGGLALFIEILNPGLVFPGVFGVVALVLAFVSFGNLPVNYAGVGLILFALVLFFFEIQVAGVGILGVGGLVSFVLGAIFLFAPFAADPPEISAPRVSISPWLIGGLGGGFGAATGLLSYLAWRGKRTFQPTTHSRLVGRSGRVTTVLDPVGTVRVAGQLWSAEEENGLTIEEGERVDVVDVDGLTLKVVKRPKLLPEGQAHALPSGLDGDEDEA